jgi:hypothetical protein
MVVLLVRIFDSCSFVSATILFRWSSKTRLVITIPNFFVHFKMLRTVNRAPIYKFVVLFAATWLGRMPLMGVAQG